MLKIKPNIQTFAPSMIKTFTIKSEKVRCTNLTRCGENQHTAAHIMQDKTNLKKYLMYNYTD